MKLQVQPNRWSCLPTAFAIITGVLVDELIQHIGHDGSYVAWPKLEPPYCYRAWHIQEIVLACYGLNYAVIPIDRYGLSSPMIDQDELQIDFNSSFSYCLANYQGVVQTTNSHALAFKNNHLYNPATGLETSIKSHTLGDTLWLVNRIKT